MSSGLFYPCELVESVSKYGCVKLTLFYHLRGLSSKFVCKACSIKQMLINFFFMSSGLFYPCELVESVSKYRCVKLTLFYHLRGLSSKFVRKACSIKQMLINFFMSSGLFYPCELVESVSKYRCVKLTLFYHLRGLSSKFVRKACSIIIRQNKTIFVHWYVDGAFKE